MEMPRPNMRIESELWRAARPLTVRMPGAAGSSAATDRVRLRAIHDGRALSILASWPDATETFTARQWVWDERRRDYSLLQLIVDQFEIHWAMTDDASFRWFDGRPARYDVWRWRAGWTNVSGYADDLQLGLVPHQADVDPATIEGELYPVRGGTGALVEMRWTPDPGIPGTVATARPMIREKTRLPGAEARQPIGSAGDVEALGLFNLTEPFKPKFWFSSGGERIPGYWFEDDMDQPLGGFWFVEFHRALVTGDEDHDYQLRGKGPHRFAVGVADEVTGDDSLISRPIRLYLD